MPTEPGEFLVSMDDGDPTLVRVPNLDDDAFMAACERAAVVRSAEPHLPLLPTDHPTDAPAQSDPFADAVLSALEAGPMTPTALRQSVAPDLTPHAFAARLKTVGGIEKGSGGTGGKLRVYRRTDRRDDALRASDSVLHAQMDTMTGGPSEVSVEAVGTP